MKGDTVIDMDLLYVKYRQQELWHEAAAQALAATVPPARPRWRAFSHGDTVSSARAPVPFAREG